MQLPGHLHPRARLGADQGRVDPSRVFSTVILALKPSASQEAELDSLLADQQNPSSPNYHHWLTPEQYADRFGASQADVDQIAAWLQQQNLTVTSVTRGRSAIWIRGTAGSVERAFGTEIHQFQVNGESHVANVTEPSVPAPLDTMVRGIRGLHDFRPSPRLAKKKPNLTVGNDHFVNPGDLAIIYNILPLYSAGFDGAGQRLAVVGQTQIQLSDLRQYRSILGLPPNDPQLVRVPNTSDPGIRSGDMFEADLDLEWTGGIARNATIVYVYSDNVLNSVLYAIDENLAPVISMSYGICEPLALLSDAQVGQSWAKQGNAQGITWINSSGDAGGADCEREVPGLGLAVDDPAGFPEVTGVGGTTFNEQGGTYWSSTNDANYVSALTYIPERVWNDSSTASGGGGASVFFAKPSWQTGPGVPKNGARNVPDISLTASANHDGYGIINEGNIEIVGGTSASAPVFAGILTLLNQAAVANHVQSLPGQGNINPRLYSLAQTTPGVFHDITVGSNIVSSAGALVGYNAGPGYDQASGLGSVDANSLVSAWIGAGSGGGRTTPAMELSSSENSITSTGKVTVTATVTGSNGGTPTGTVTFLLGNNSLGIAHLVGSGDAAAAALLIGGSQLQIGADLITAVYSGDVSYNGVNAAITVNVVSNASVAPSITGLANSASFRRVYAPGMILSIFGERLAPVPLSADSVPLPTQIAGVFATINGVRAPLYFVSPGLLNIQIPYEAPPNNTAVLVVNNNGLTASVALFLSSVAPGIFADASVALVPSNRAARGQTIALYMTGAGAVSPPVATGTAPAAGTPLANLPQPMQPTQVTVAGVPAFIQFIGITPGSVGVMQINFQIPQTAPLGAQSLVVTVGAVSSVPVTLNITD